MLFGLFKKKPVAIQPKPIKPKKVKKAFNVGAAYIEYELVNEFHEKIKTTLKIYGYVDIYNNKPYIVHAKDMGAFVPDDVAKITAIGNDSRKPTKFVTGKILSVQKLDIIEDHFQEIEVNEE